MESTARDREGRLIAFKAETLKAMIYALLEPLQSLGVGEQVYAVGGEILGPDVVNGTGKVVKVGVWELRADPAPPLIHDEF